MLWKHLKSRLGAFARDDDGQILVETVMTLPLLFWGLAATYEFFEVHRFESARVKATYTVADMLSRENDAVTEVYVDNAKVLFDQMTSDYGDNQVRISVIRFNAPQNRYEVSWSRVRGHGDMTVLTDSQVANDHAKLPIMQDGEEVIVVESEADYRTIFDVGLSDNMTIATRVFTSLRFAPQLCFEQCQS